MWLLPHVRDDLCGCYLMSAKSTSGMFAEPLLRAGIQNLNPEPEALSNETEEGRGSQIPRRPNRGELARIRLAGQVDLKPATRCPMPRRSGQVPAKLTPHWH